MHKGFDISQVPSGNPEVEYYRSLARLAEEQARDIRRIAALERARLEERLRKQEPSIQSYEAELEALKQSYEQLKCSFENLKQKSEHYRQRSQDFRSDLSALKAQLRSLRRAQDKIAQSRAHRLAEAYIQHAIGNSVFARSLRVARSFIRVLERARRMARIK